MKISFSIKFAIAAGIINCLSWYFYSQSLTPYSLQVEQYRYFTTLALLLVGIFVSIYMERKKEGGYVSFKIGLKTGFLYTIVLALFLAVFNFIYYKYIAIDAIDYFLNDARKAMTEAKIKEEDILKNLENLKNYFGSFRMMMSTVILGLILSLISAAILQKKNRTIPFSEN